MLDLSTGTALRAARRKYGLTQAQLAKAMGVRQPGSIHQMEVRPQITPEAQVRLRTAFAGLMPVESLETITASELDTAHEQALRGLTALYRIAQQYMGSDAPALVSTLGTLLTDVPSAPVRGGARSPEQKAADKVAYDAERKRLTRLARENAQRDADRPHVQALHARLKPLAASQDWDAYRVAVLEAHKACHIAQEYLDAYCAVAIGQVVDDTDPLVTLPLES